MNVLRDFLSHSYWGFRSPFEVKGEGYEFSKVGLESVTTLIVLKAYLVWKTKLYGMCKEIGEVGRLIAQDQCLLVQTSVFHAIENLLPLQFSLNLDHPSHNVKTKIHV